MGYKHKAIILALGLFLIGRPGLGIASPSTQCLLHTCIESLQVDKSLMKVRKLRIKDLWSWIDHLDGIGFS